MKPADALANSIKAAQEIYNKPEYKPSYALTMPTSRSLKVGDRAPSFTLPSSTGQPVDLGEYLSRGPVVLAWYLFDFGRV
jgi:hypothetical protein